MKIKEIFVQEESKVIKELVSNLQAEGCIRKYFDYIDSNGETDFEKDYIRKLSMRLKNFILGLKKEELKDKTAEELIKLYLGVLWDGVWYYDNMDYNEMREDLEYNYSDSDLHIKIKTEMQEALDELLKEKSESAKAVRIKNKEDDIARQIATIESYDKQKEQAYKNLENLKKELKILKAN